MNDLKGIIEDCNKSDLVSKKIIEKVIKIIGQKRWNRIHDEESDICTTMGELIITLKGVPDLEKEKCELLGIIQGKDKVIKDLKEDNKVMSDNYSKMEQKFYDNISKAKEIIRQLCLMVRELNNPNIQLTNVDYSLSEAEQFLKEE